MNNNQEISKLEKISLAVKGVAYGLAPSRIQVQNAGDEQRAGIMSTSSRVVDATLAVYGVAYWVGRAFGVDLDPTNGVLATIGTIAIPETIIREGSFALYYTFQHPNIGKISETPWGEPIWELIDGHRHSEEYKTK